MKRIIGVTGGVGAGKSSVLKILEDEFHACVIIADEVGRELMEPGHGCYDQVVEAFGEEMLLPDRRLDRRSWEIWYFRTKKSWQC